MSTRIPSCLLCRCQCKQHLFVIQANGDDPDFISDEIARLDITIHTLKLQQDHRLNTICSSTNDLPNEILLPTSTDPSSCMLCGSPCKEHAFVSQGNNSDRDSISNDIEKLDIAIRTLRILKSQRCCQLNTIRSSTRTLPNEILLSIFQIFCSRFRSHTFPQFILGGVCNHWRNLVNSAPLFWKKINSKTRQLPQTLSLLEVFKERNGASFESMQLWFGSLWDQSLPLVQRLVQSIRGVSTLQRITLYDPPVSLLQTINNYSNVCEVALAGFPYFINELKSIPGFSLPWSTLTTLKLSRININICCDLLLGCPNLIWFTSYDPSKPPSDYIRPDTHHARETCFPHLRRLTWHYHYSEWDDNFLSLYRFPALQRIHWRGGEHYHSPELFHDFISSLPPSCHTFHLSATAEHDLRLEKEILLQIKYPVEQLICSHFNAATLSVALERLRDPAFIPSLTFFRWENRGRSYFDEEEILELTESFKGILRIRKEIGVGKFRMEIAGGIEFYFDPSHDEKKFHELMAGDEFHFSIGKNDCWIMSF